MGPHLTMFDRHDSQSFDEAFRELQELPLIAGLALMFITIVDALTHGGTSSVEDDQGR